MLALRHVSNQSSNPIMIAKLAKPKSMHVSVVRDNGRNDGFLFQITFSVLCPGNLQFGSHRQRMQDLK